MLAMFRVESQSVIFKEVLVSQLQINEAHVSKIVGYDPNKHALATTSFK